MDIIIMSDTIAAALYNVSYGYGITGYYSKVSRNLAMSHVTHALNQIGSMFKLVLPQYNIMVVPEHLEVKLHEQISLTQLADTMFLNVVLEDMVIVSIPLNFMILLNEPVVYDDKMYIQIPFQLFMDNIKLMCLKKQEVTFELINGSTCFSEVNMCMKYIITANEVTEQLEEQPQEMRIQLLNTNQITISPPSTEIEYRLIENESGCVKGMFLECEDVDNIKDFVLTLYGKPRFDYNKFMIRSKCKKIHQRLLYIPFNDEKTMYDMSETCFEGSIYFRHLYVWSLFVNFDTPCSKLGVHFLSCSNYFRCMNGKGGLAYGTNFNQHSTTTVTGISSSFVCKPIVNDNKLICGIRHEPIAKNDHYMCCNTCFTNYGKEEIKKWLKKKETCPTCREKWSDKTIYINSLDPPTAP